MGDDMGPLTDVNRLDANLWVHVDPQFHDRPVSVAPCKACPILSP